MLPGRGPAFPDLAIDLGSAWTRVATRGRGRVDAYPSALAVRSTVEGREVVALGEEAVALEGRTPADTRIVRPVRGGLVEDHEGVEPLLARAVRHASTRSSLRRPRALVSVPLDASETERRALQSSARAAGCGEVTVLPGLLAAAVGADLPVFEARGSMIVLLGGGRTEVAVISLGGLVARRSLRVAGDAMSARIAHWLRRHMDLMVGEGVGERLKHEVGAAQDLDRMRQARIRGRDLSTGQPRTSDITTTHVAEALAPSVLALCETVTDVLRETPPEIAADILQSGIVLAGGGARLPELDVVLRDAVELPVIVAEAPELRVVDGLARLLDDAETLHALVEA